MRWSWWAVLGLLLAACARQPPVPELSQPARELHWQQHQAAVTALDQWSLTGRVAVRQGREGWQAGLRWQQQHAAYRLRIMAPLARGTWQLEGDEHGASLTTPQREQLLATDVESLLRENVGWGLPVAGARYWIAGIPDPNREYQQLDLDSQGRLARLGQTGWRIEVLEYMTVTAYQLPKRLRFQRDGLDVQLAVTRWDLPADR